MQGWKVNRKMKKKTFNRKNVKRDKQKKKTKLYFGKEAHDAIVKYQTTDCRREKSKIYEKEIKNSLDNIRELI